MRNLLLIAAAALALGACGKKSGTTTPEKTDLAWADMNHEQRQTYMKETVLPTMSAEFQKLDPKEFGSMDCTTCHGERAKQGDFEMPNPALPKLNVAKFEQLAQEKPQIMEFMAYTVVPKMAGLLKEEPYNPETQQGFGCFRCHTQE